MSNPNNKKVVVLLFVATLCMFGFGFALVPLYNTLCKTLGINGKIQDKPVVLEASKLHVDKTRWITVEFVTTLNGATPWIFYPKTKKIRIHPGEVKRLLFYAENQTDVRMTVQAIPNVTPGLAAKYIKKTECFCFTEQSLNAHEAMDMPLLFHVDPALPRDIHTITLSYTLFDVSKKSHT